MNSDTVKTVIGDHEMDVPERLMPVEPITFSIGLDDIHWFEDAFSAWEVNDFSGVLDGLNKAVKHFREPHDDLVNALKAHEELYQRGLLNSTSEQLEEVKTLRRAALRKAGVN